MTSALEGRPDVGYCRAMITRWVCIVGVTVALAACAEVVRGPRVVHYTPDRFYIRNVPAIETWPPVTEFELAAIICARSAREPVLESAEQYNPIDIRYSTFRCVTEEELAFTSTRGGL